MTKTSRVRAGRMAPELRKSQLLKSAICQFANLGIGRAVHADVAEHAQVAVPTVFSYFPTGDVLKLAVIEEVADKLFQMIGAASTTEISSELRLKNVLRAFARMVDEQPNVIKIWMDWSTIISPPTWSAYESFQDGVLSTFESFIEDGIADGTLRPDLNAIIGAHTVMGAGHMIAQMKFRHRDDQLIDEFIENIVHNALFV